MEELESEQARDTTKLLETEREMNTHTHSLSHTLRDVVSACECELEREQQ